MAQDIWNQFGYEVLENKGRQNHSYILCWFFSSFLCLVICVKLVQITPNKMGYCELHKKTKSPLTVLVHRPRPTYLLCLFLYLHSYDSWFRWHQKTFMLRLLIAKKTSCQGHISENHLLIHDGESIQRRVWIRLCLQSLMEHYRLIVQQISMKFHVEQLLIMSHLTNILVSDSRLVKVSQHIFLMMKWEGDCTAVVCEVVCCTVVRPGL